MFIYDCMIVPALYMSDVIGAHKFFAMSVVNFQSKVSLVVLQLVKFVCLYPLKHTFSSSLSQVTSMYLKLFMLIFSTYRCLYGNNILRVVQDA